MTVKEPFTIDLFDGKYFGAWTDDWEKTQRGKRPKIRKMGMGFFSSLLPFINSTKSFNYEIDPDENVKTIDTFFGITFKVLIPTESVPKCNVNQTIFGKIDQFSESRTADLEDELKDKKRKIRQLEQDKKRLMEEQEEQQKHKSKNKTKQVKCPSCGKGFSPQKWTAEDGECPNCDYTYKRYKNDD